MLIQPRLIRGLLVVAIVLAPMTALRLSLFGPAEIILGILFVYQAGKGVSKRLLGQFPLTKFWGAYILVCLIGAATNALLLRNPTGTWGGFAFDLAAYVFVLMTCFTLERLASHDMLDVKALARQAFLWSATVLTALYGVSLLRPTVLGFRLTYYGHFVPLADNLHQVSMFLVPLPFLGIWALARERTILKRIVVVALVVMCCVMAISTGSAKAPLALAAGAAVFVYSVSMRIGGRPLALIVNAVYLVCFVVLVEQLDLVARATGFFIDNDLSGARQQLYYQGMLTGLSSFLVGRGPGSHVVYVPGHFSDAHQTFLTVFLQGGVAGLILWGALIIRIARRTFREPALLAAFSTIVVYASGGDVLRRLPVWFVLFMVVSIPAARTPRRPRVAIQNIGPPELSPSLRYH